jgi:signal peptidase I
MKRRMIFLRIRPSGTCVLSQSCVALFAFAVLALGARGESAQPSLVWEREYDKDVLAAGVDIECFLESGADIGLCLKWVMLKGEGYLFENAGEDSERHRVIPSGIVYPDDHISPSGRYLLVPTRGAGPDARREGFRYTLYDWNGDVVWEMNDGRLMPFVRDNGSMVLLEIPRDIRTGTLKEIMFFDRSGRKISTYRFKDTQYMGPCTCQASSSNFLALVTWNAERHCADVHVFDESGKLAWKAGGINPWYTSSSGERRHYAPRSLAVSDSGEVILWLYGNIGAKALVYDASGVPGDTIVFRNSSFPVATAYGRLAFAAISPLHSKDGRLLCYDFAKMRVKFVLEEPGIDWVCDVSQGRDEVVISVGLDENWTDWALRVCDLSGNVKSTVSVETQRPNSPWCRILGGSLLVADRNFLRLYDMKGGE